MHACLPLFVTFDEEKKANTQVECEGKRLEMNQIAPLKERVLENSGMSIKLDTKHPGAFPCTMPIVRRLVSIDKLMVVVAVINGRHDNDDDECQKSRQVDKGE